MPKAIAPFKLSIFSIRWEYHSGRYPNKLNAIADLVD
jgi:hypothetical protein